MPSHDWGIFWNWLMFWNSNCQTLVYDSTTQKIQVLHKYEITLVDLFWFEISDELFWRKILVFYNFWKNCRQVRIRLDFKNSTKYYLVTSKVMHHWRSCMMQMIRTIVDKQIRLGLCNDVSNFFFNKTSDILDIEELLLYK